MSNIFSQWLRHRFSDPQAVFLALFLLIGFTVVITMGQMLAPVIASVIIAYLLESSVARLEQRGIPRLVIVIVMVLLFTTFLMFVLFGLLPLLSGQITQLIKELPNYFVIWEDALRELPDHYIYFSEQQVTDLIATMRVEPGHWGSVWFLSHCLPYLARLPWWCL